jgi:pyrimidine deaminase RibD-like protein
MDLPPAILPGDHVAAMRLALTVARQSPCLPTKFCVGALIVNSATGQIAATGYSLELPGNTHAEECCLLKLARMTTTDTAAAATDLPAALEITEPHTLYTTMEPCARRLSGRTPCVERVLAQRTWLRTVCYGIREPDTFVATNEGLDVLRREGVEVVHVGELEDEIRQVATAGHGDNR